MKKKSRKIKKQSQRRINKITDEQKLKILWNIVKKEDPEKYRIARREYEKRLKEQNKEITKTRKLIINKLKIVSKEAKSLHESKSKILKEGQKLITILNRLFKKHHKDKTGQSIRELSLGIKKSVSDINDTTTYKMIESLTALAQKWDGSADSKFRKKFEKMSSSTLRIIALDHKIVAQTKNLFHRTQTITKKIREMTKKKKRSVKN